MIIISEVEKVIAQLSPQEARMLRYWLNEYQAARRYNKLKAYTKAARTLAHFDKNNGDSSFN